MVADAVLPMHASATYVGSTVPATHAPAAQSEFDEHAPVAGSSTQYEPTGDATPVRSMTFSKHGQLRRMHVPAPSQSKSVWQKRYGFREQWPSSAVGVSQPASPSAQHSSACARPQVRSAQ